jgi:hypothetical protein
VQQVALPDSGKAHSVACQQNPLMWAMCTLSSNFPVVMPLQLPGSSLQARRHSDCLGPFRSWRPCAPAHLPLFHNSRQGFSVRLYASTLYAVRCSQYAARPVQYVPTVRCCTLCVPFSSVAAAGMCAGSGLALSGSRVRKELLQHVACL